MSHRVTISFVEDEEIAIDDNKVFWQECAQHMLLRWTKNASEINVSVEPIAASRDEATLLQSQVAEFMKRHGDEYFKDLDFRNSATAALNIFNLRKYYGCDDGGAQ